MDDAALVRAARGGDKEAFASIYDRYADRLHGFLHTILRDRDEAADVLHDTFIDAGAHLGQLRDPAKLRPWLFATARHNAFRRLRERSRSEPVAEVDVTATTHDPAEDASRAELRELVVAAAEGLSPRDRAALDLHLTHGLEGQELGEALGVTAGHAYVLLTRLRGQFERALGALLVARRGAEDCSELAGLLEGWDGRFSPLLRKRVARHIDGCEICGETRKRTLTPAELLGTLPLVPAPRDVRERVLDNVELVAHRSWLPARRRGFPPHEADPIRRLRRAVLAATAVAMLVVGGMIVLGGEPEVATAEISTPSPIAEVIEEPPLTSEPTLDSGATARSRTPSAPAPATQSPSGGTVIIIGPTVEGEAETGPRPRDEPDPDPDPGEREGSDDREEEPTRPRPRSR